MISKPTTTSNYGKGNFKSVNKSKSSEVAGAKISRSKSTSAGKSAPEMGRTPKYGMKGLSGPEKMV